MAETRLSADPEWELAVIALRMASLERMIGDTSSEPEDIARWSRELATVRRTHQDIRSKVIGEAGRMMERHHTRHCYHDVGLEEGVCCWCGLMESELDALTGSDAA